MKDFNSKNDNYTISEYMIILKHHISEVAKLLLELVFYRKSQQRVKN